MSGDGGDFGDWSEDEDALPCFDLRGAAVAGDVWHAVGNDRITATAHADGATTLYWAEEGLVRVGRSAPLGAPAALATRFGCGYAVWRHERGALSIERRVWAPFGEAPALRIEVALAGSLPAIWSETWRFAPYPFLLGPLMSRRVPAPRGAALRERALWNAMLAASSAARALTEGARRALGWRMRLRGRFDPALGAILLATATAPRDAREAGWIPRLPQVVFLASLGADPEARLDGRGRRTDASLRVPLASGAERARLAFAVGVAPVAALPELLAALRAAEPRESGAAWRRIWRLELPAAPALERESAWHAVQLRGAQVRDAVLGSRYVPQGSAYSYVHGLQGAPRDYALCALALAFLDPAGARDLLRLSLRLVRADGAVHYAHAGAGMPTSAGVHDAPSDLPLFLLWAVTDYVWAAQDRAFAVEAAPVLARTWRWLRDAIGVGAHGLLRIGSGDWNDPITAFAPSRRAFHRDGESTFDSAMAAYVLPRAALLVPDEAPGMRKLAAALRDAAAATWAGAWFLRGYDGLGGAIGRENLFLDANAWCLVAKIGSDAQRAELIRSIAERCDDPSPIGPTILDRPHRVRAGILPPGHDVNGGVWPAIGALTVWGLALHDPERAWRSLAKQTFAAHARAHPHVWYGIWSGPDAYNSRHGERPGETYVQPATPMREFPVMNSNAHAGPLLALLKALGVEATPGGVVVEPRAPASLGSWRLTTALGAFEAPADAR
jgi:hypothetical protein